MNETEYSKIKRELRNYLITLIGAVLLGAITFYFNTKYSLEQYDRRIEKLENQIELRATIESVNAIKSDYKAELREIREDTKYIREWIMNKAK
jgi:hypothetical protein